MNVGIVTSCTVAFLFACVTCQYGDLKPEVKRKLQQMHSVDELLKKFKETITCKETSKKHGKKLTCTRPNPNPLWRHEDLKFEMAEQAACKPRRVLTETSTLRPKDEEGNSYSVIWPTVIASKQCGGGCNDMTRRCGVTPGGYSVKTVNLMAISHNDNKVHFVKHSYQQHKSCSCAECKVKAYHCSGREKYVETECRCACPATHVCGRNKQWSPSVCDCVCSNHHEESSCVGEKKIWSDDDCQCITLSHAIGRK